MTDSEPRAGGWQATPALSRVIVLVTLAVLLGAALGRAELVLLVVPLAVGTGLALMTRPPRPPRPQLELDEPGTVEGGAVSARVEVANEGERTLLCVVNVQVPHWVRLRHGVGYYATPLPPRTGTTVRIEGTAQRWGAYRLGPAVARTVAADGLLVTDSAVMPSLALSVYPAGEGFDSTQPLPRASGITGIHRSRRPGDGGELAEVRPFHTGDRLRRINWRVSQRTGTLHVNTTWADRDADVLLVLDVRHESGESGGVGGRATVLDQTVRAAAAIAEHYTQQGDRVGLLEFGTGLRRLPGGAGARHFRATLEWLAQVDPAPRALSLSPRLLTVALRPPHALVIVLTPLLDADVVGFLAGLARTGRSMVTVDTLPSGAALPRRTSWTELAVRLWWWERANTIDRLRNAGVPVERWQGAGSLDLMLRHAHQMSARAARAVAR